MRSAYNPRMVAKGGKSTQIRRSARKHLYIEEWMEERGLSDQTLGNRMGVARQTVYRWRTQQHRLDPAKQEAIAEALNIEAWRLWQLPPPPDETRRRSIDEMLKDVTDDQFTDALDFVERFIIKRAG